MDLGVIFFRKLSIGSLDTYLIVSKLWFNCLEKLLEQYFLYSLLWYSLHIFVTDSAAAFLFAWSSTYPFWSLLLQSSSNAVPQEASFSPIAHGWSEFKSIPHGKWNVNPCSSLGTSFDPEISSWIIVKIVINYCKPSATIFGLQKWWRSGLFTSPLKWTANRYVTRALMLVVVEAFCCQFSSIGAIVALIMSCNYCHRIVWTSTFN